MRSVAGQTPSIADPRENARRRKAWQKASPRFRSGWPSRSVFAVPGSPPGDDPATPGPAGQARGWRQRKRFQL